jgi:hypothetical protein
MPASQPRLHPFVRHRRSDWLFPEDGLEEIIVRDLYDFMAIGCLNGKIVVLLDYSSEANGPAPSLVYKGDMNANGTPEVVLAFRATTGWNTVVDIFEWDGEEFAVLTKACHGFASDRTSRLARGLYWYETDWLPWEPTSPCQTAPMMNGRADIQVKDLDNNGTKELILRDFGPAHLDALYNFGPWRGKKVVFEWDGRHFLYSSLEIDPPEYRFQALQDAGRLFLLGDYDLALPLYQDVIFSDKLEWWSFDRTRNFADRFFTSLGDGPTPTLLPLDDSEYAPLAAYARYRIYLNHIARGWFPEAQTVLDGLRSRFSDDPVAAPYVEAANLFSTSFEATSDPAAACAVVIDYFRRAPELLAPLGDAYHGLQSHVYTPEDTCPLQ